MHLIGNSIQYLLLCLSDLVLKDHHNILELFALRVTWVILLYIPDRFQILVNLVRCEKSELHIINLKYDLPISYKLHLLLGQELSFVLFSTYLEKRLGVSALLNEVLWQLEYELAVV